MEITVRTEHIDMHAGHENLSLLHISDIHLWYSKRILNKLHAIIDAQSPDLLVFTGDYYDIPGGARHFREFLLAITPPHTAVFIHGNHDRIYGSKITGLLSGIPGCICVDDAIYRYRSSKGHDYNLTSWQNRSLLPQNASEKNIVLIHNPERIRINGLSNIQLLLAGHLHGGQFIFFTKNNMHFPGSLLYRYCTDRKQVGDTVVIVSKGLGDTLPFRWNCPKEVVRINIR